MFFGRRSCALRTYHGAFDDVTESTRWEYFDEWKRWCVAEVDGVDEKCHFMRYDDELPSIEANALDL